MIKEVEPKILLGRELNDIEKKNAPKSLYISGNMDVPVPGPRVAIVGTRKPTSEGVSIAFRLSQELSGRGVVIISGLARGIDTAAHKGAIGNNGKTISVLGTPLNKFYPPENKQLQMEITKNGLLVSQFAQNQPIQRRNFVMRNRTMALISDASVIIEAGDSSGTLSQGWETLRLGKPLFIWESVFKNEELKWPKELLEYGAIRVNESGLIFDNLPYGNEPYEVQEWQEI